MGGMGLRRRRRHRHLEVAPEVELPDHRRPDTHGGRRRILRRRRRQLLRTRSRHRPEALGAGSRRRNRRRCYHLYRGRCAKGCRRGWLYQHHLADEARPRQGRRAWPRQQVRSLVMQFDPVFLSRSEPAIVTSLSRTSAKPLSLQRTSRQPILTRPQFRIPLGHWPL